MPTRLIVVLLIAWGCASVPPQAPSTPAPAAAKPTADELFAAGRHGEAIAAYKHELERGDHVVELQIFLVLARLANQEPGWSLIDDLRAVERTYPRSRWAHLAAVLANEIDRGTVLRQAVMAAGADLRAAEQRLAASGERVAGLVSQTADLQASIAALREERTRLQQQFREAEDRATARDARVLELEAELAALKQVDMQRAP